MPGMLLRLGMRTPVRALVEIVALACLALLLCVDKGWTAGPTLARLSFWVPPERMGEFAAVYEAKILPVLRHHGLISYSEQGRGTPENVYSRLFVFHSPSEATDRHRTLENDQTWNTMLRELGEEFGLTGPDDTIGHRFGLYAAPVGSGRVASVGSGHTVGADHRSDVWHSYKMTEGISDVSVYGISRDREGHLWFGTSVGASRYDGQSFTTFTTHDGLETNMVRAISQAKAGHLWFGTLIGASRYDGQNLVTFTTRDGLGSNLIFSILQDRKGFVWFGTGDGLTRYDGETFTVFTTEDGLADNQVWNIFQDRVGHLWFGTSGGVSQYSGSAFTTFAKQHGLVDDRVYSITQDRDGYLWFGTSDGVSRYDGQTFRSFGVEDGLAGGAVWSIYQDVNGYLWFGTKSGISRYNGQMFQTIAHREGLQSNSVLSIFQDEKGDLWFGTAGAGVTVYRPSTLQKPHVFIDAVMADRRYQNLSALSIPSSVDLVAFEFHGTSLRNAPDAIAYRYRLTGYDADWQTTSVRWVEYRDLPMGRYTFEIHATEDDLVSETSVTVALNVGLPYRQIGLVSILCLILAGIWLIARASHRDRSSQGSPAEPEKNDNDRIREWVMEHIQAELRGRISLMKKEETDEFYRADHGRAELPEAGPDAHDGLGVLG